MGLRFRKSFKIAPGVKFNLNKKSAGLTFGGKGAHYTINSRGRKTATVGIPGTGISYTKSSGGGNQNYLGNNSYGGRNQNYPSGNNLSGGNGNFFSRIVSFFTSQGCLGYLAGLIAALIAISVALFVLIIVGSILWIPATAAAIFFFAKADKKKGIIFSCISVLSILVLIYFAANVDNTDSTGNRDNRSHSSAFAIETESPKPSITPKKNKTKKTSEEPTLTPTIQPTQTIAPTDKPTQTAKPTVKPTVEPTVQPTQEPVVQETEKPVEQPQTVEEQPQQIQEPTSSDNEGGNANNFNTYDNPEQQQTSNEWVLNTSSKKIHYPSCRDVKRIKPENYSTSNSSVDELKAQGYSTCGHCF